MSVFIVIFVNLLLVFIRGRGEVHCLAGYHVKVIAAPLGECPGFFRSYSVLAKVIVSGHFYTKAMFFRALALDHPEGK